MTRTKIPSPNFTNRANISQNLTNAKTWFAPTASRYAFSPSNDMVFVLLPHLPQYHQSILAMLNLLGTLPEAGKLLDLVTITILLSPVLQYNVRAHGEMGNPSAASAGGGTAVRRCNRQ